jgi:hypothetical protein
MLHKERERIEGLGLEVDDVGATPQFAAFDVEPVIAERQNHAVPRKLPTCNLPEQRLSQIAGGKKEAAARVSRSFPGRGAQRIMVGLVSVGARVFWGTAGSSSN